MSDSLHQRAEALVDLYFRQVDAARLEAMRAQAAQAAAASALATKLGLDAGAAAALVAVGLSYEALAAYAIIPLLHVAWSDTSLAPAEREAVLGHARELGVTDESAAGQALAGWLTREPQPQLFEAWKAAHQTLAPELRRDLDRSVLAGARAVARATGGLGPLGAISATERAALGEIEALLGA